MKVYEVKIERDGEITKHPTSTQIITEVTYYAAATIGDVFERVDAILSPDRTLTSIREVIPMVVVLETGAVTQKRGNQI